MVGCRRQHKGRRESLTEQKGIIMDLRHISSEAWSEFTEKHHSAYMYLVHESNKGELRSLERDRQMGIRLNDWQEKRLLELQELSKRIEYLENLDN